MTRKKIYEALKGVRGRPPVDLALLDKIFVRFSELVVSQRWIKEIDINPLLAHSEGQGATVADCRIILEEVEEVK